jgi:hypothetical protein
VPGVPGPKLLYLVAACTAADGTFWTLQRWERLKPNGGGTSAPAELWPSHFTQVARFEGVRTQGQLVTGRYTFRGRGIYLDLYNSQLGPGWRRENSFLAQRPNGEFRNRLKNGTAERYRVCAIGPGVTPIVCHTWR